MTPTPARLDLLQAIDDGEVVQHPWRRMKGPYSVRDHGPGANGLRHQIVTGRIREFLRAGWITLGPADSDYRYGDPERWILTPAGRAVLDSQPQERTKEGNDG